MLTRTGHARTMTMTKPTRTRTRTRLARTRTGRQLCELDPAEIRTSNLPITSRALYHTATAVIVTKYAGNCKSNLAKL